MNAELDELLRDGMARFTADLHAPADLADRIRRSRRQRLALRTAAGSGIAAIAAAAIAFVIVPTTMTSSPLGSPTAPVTERLDVEHLDITGSDGSDSEQDWVYGDQARQLITTSTGRPLEDEASAVVRAKDGSKTVLRTIVQFRTKIWGRGRQGAFRTVPRSSCAHPNLSYPAGPRNLPAWIRALHQLVGCGAFVIAGHQQIDRIRTIKLIATTLAENGSGLFTAIWVKRNYVPVRMAWGTAMTSWRVDVSWLPPTEANLAQLRVPIPAGFRRVALRYFRGLVPTS